jgi:hypothetical protein
MDTFVKFLIISRSLPHAWQDNLNYMDGSAKNPRPVWILARTVLIKEKGLIGNDSLNHLYSKNMESRKLAFLTGIMK